MANEVKVSISTNGHEATIHIKTGQFSYRKLHNEFHKIYRTKEVANASSRVIDLNGVNIMDSSGLAMLLTMRDFLGNDKANIKITGANQQVKEILTLEGFDQLFVIG